MLLFIVISIFFTVTISGTYVDADQLSNKKDFGSAIYISDSKSSKPTASKPRIVVNGKVHEVNGYRINGEYYFRLQDISKVLSGSNKPTTQAILDKKAVTAASMTVDKMKYIKIRDVAKNMDFSYTHDTVLDAVYVWTDLYYNEDAQVVAEEITRAKNHGFIPKSLQNNLSKQITFKEYCQMLRNLVTTCDSKLVSEWDKIAKKAAVSNSAMTRGDGMLAILEAAVVLKVNQFNTDWGSINNRIGGKCWDELYNRNDTLFTNISQKKYLQMTRVLIIGPDHYFILLADSH